MRFGRSLALLLLLQLQLLIRIATSTTTTTTTTPFGCERGSVVVNGNSCTPCAPGTFMPPATTTCVNHTACSAGFRLLQLGNATDDNACVPCDANTFSTAPSTASSCTPVDMCGPGQRAAFPGNTTANSACAACPPETFREEAQHLFASCQICGSCQPGHIRVGCNATFAGVCEVPARVCGAVFFPHPTRALHTSIGSKRG